MKKQANILRSTGFLVLCLIWLTSVFGKVIPTIQQQKQAEKVEKSAQKKTNTEKNDKTQTFISDLSLAVVSPSQAFSFVYDAFILPIPQFIFIAVEKVTLKVEKPYFILSYFANTFEHHIAINAP